MSDIPVNKNRSLSWIIWIPMVLLALYFFLMLVNTDAFPPAWYVRRSQEQKLMERVQFAGGWEAIRHDCILLAQTNEIVQRIRWRTNDAPPLPQAIAALQPQQVDFLSPKFLGAIPGEPRTPVVRIKLFGMHSTGGHSTPYFGLEVVTDSSTKRYTPKASTAASGNGFLNYQMISEGIYEIY